jgi:hypothetical protein
VQKREQFYANQRQSSHSAGSSVIIGLEVVNQGTHAIIALSVDSFDVGDASAWRPDKMEKTRSRRAVSSRSVVLHRLHHNVLHESNEIASGIDDQVDIDGIALDLVHDPILSADHFAEFVTAYWPKDIENVTTLGEAADVLDARFNLRVGIFPDIQPERSDDIATQALKFHFAAFKECRFQ